MREKVRKGKRNGRRGRIMKINEGERELTDKQGKYTILEGRGIERTVGMCRVMKEGREEDLVMEEEKGIFRAPRQ